MGIEFGCLRWPGAREKRYVIIKESFPSSPSLTDHTYDFGIRHDYRGEKRLYIEFAHPHLKFRQGQNSWKLYNQHAGYVLSQSVLISEDDLRYYPVTAIVYEPYGLPHIWGPLITFDRAARRPWSLDNDFYTLYQRFEYVIQLLARQLFKRSMLGLFLNYGKVYSSALFIYADDMARMALSVIGVKGHLGKEKVEKACEGWTPAPWKFYLPIVFDYLSDEEEEEERGGMDTGIEIIDVQTENWRL